MSTKTPGNDKTVTITFTQEQYKTLLKAVYLGDWMVNNWRDPLEYDLAFEDLEQHVYKHAKDVGLSDWVEYEKDIQQFSPSLEMEDTMLELTEDFTENTFWEELAQRLSERDLIQMFGEEKIEKMEMEESLAAAIPIVEKYYNEFDEYGVERLRIPPSVVQLNPKVRPS